MKSVKAEEKDGDMCCLRRLPHYEIIPSLVMRSRTRTVLFSHLRWYATMYLIRVMFPVVREFIYFVEFRAKDPLHFIFFCSGCGAYDTPCNNTLPVFLDTYFRDTYIERQQRCLMHDVACALSRGVCQSPRRAR